MNATYSTTRDTDECTPLPGTDRAEPDDFAALNELLRGEMSATETYDLALLKFDHLRGAEELRVIRDEHATSSAQLRDCILSHGGIPSESSGSWGSLVTGLTSVAKVLGPKSVLATLRQGEVHGIKTYEHALENDHLSSDCRTLIAEELLPSCRLHVGELQELSDTLR